MVSSGSPFSLSAFAMYPKPTTPQRLSNLSAMRHTQRPPPMENCDLDLVPTSKSGFFTHAKTRVYPLTIATHRPQSAEEDYVNVSGLSEGQGERPRLGTSQQPRKSLNRLRRLREAPLSPGPAPVDCSVPPISYRQFRSQHIKRKNSTTPSRRQYEDHSIGSDSYNHPNAAKRFYKPQVIRLTARSKIVLHSSFPIQLPDHQTAPSPKKPIPKANSPEVPKHPHSSTVSPPREESRPLAYSPEAIEPLALTFGEKLLKVQRVVEASRLLS